MVPQIMAAEADVADALVESGTIATPPKYKWPAATKAGAAIALVALTAVALVLMTRSSAQFSLKSDALVTLQDVSYTNVLGGPLQECSKPGMALTGFTRDGHCIDSGDDDQGAHHICIQMKKDFCTVTGQPDWCEEKMECMGQAGKCPIGNWCVCQWAFATYLDMAGGCDQIVELQCDATNMAAFKAYEKSTDPRHKTALTCIKSKCGIQ
jgi:uncharacterized protein (DUF2237 family)